MTQEALKLALEAMESVTVECNNFHHPKKDQNHDWAKCPPIARWDKAITAIKKALAQRTEPVIDQSAAIRIATALGWTPPRTWVGLTDEEYTYITDTVFHTGQGLVAYYKAIEAKLKEKNT